MSKRHKGAALITACVITVFLSIAGIAFSIRSIQERSLAVRYVDSVRAFWLAEAALAKGYSELMNDSSYGGAGWTTLAGGDYRVIRGVTSGGVEVRGEGSSGSATQALSFTLVFIPFPFENTISVGGRDPDGNPVGGDLSLSGIIGSIAVYGKTRLSGEFTKSGSWTSASFEDKVEGADTDYTAISVPDGSSDANTKDNDFSDFVDMGREVIADYPEEEVVYLQTNGTVNIFPNRSLAGKKVIFVEGDNPGEGNVNIFFDTSWQDDQDVTIISTGEVAYVQPLDIGSDSRLSIISWGDYNEASIFRSTHESVIYTHGDADYADILDWGSTTGNIIVQENMAMYEYITNSKFYYSDRAFNGDLPPGFSRLTAGAGVLSSRITDWQEKYD
jgi:hypothetical protein